MNEDKTILTLINVVGVLQIPSIHKTCEMDACVQEIILYMREDFPRSFQIKTLKIIMEPERSLVGRSGISTTEVVLISKITSKY
jgi:diaminopimelate decarboxylase